KRFWRRVNRLLTLALLRQFSAAELTFHRAAFVRRAAAMICSGVRAKVSPASARSAHSETFTRARKRLHPTAGRATASGCSLGRGVLTVVGYATARFCR